RHVNFTWQINKNTNKGDFTDLLKRYRSEFVLQVVNGKEVIKPGSAYLLPEEKGYINAPLSFDLVKKAFTHEYAHRYYVFRKQGGKADMVAAPPLIPAN